MSESDLVNPSQLSTKIEAILYLKAQALSIQELAEYAICEIEDVEEALLTLMQDYALRNSALEVVETNAGFSLQLREAYMSLVQTIVPTDLGVGALRTLAAIALKGPIPQTQLVELRGSGAYQHVGDLAEEGFVSKRRQSNGRSFSVQVTEKFYQYFEVDELPKLKLKNSAKRRRVVEKEESEGESPSSNEPQEPESNQDTASVDEPKVNIEAESDQANTIDPNLTAGETDKLQTQETKAASTSPSLPEEDPTISPQGSDENGEETDTLTPSKSDIETETETSSSETEKETEAEPSTNDVAVDVTSQPSNKMQAISQPETEIETNSLSTEPNPSSIEEETSP